MGLDLLSFQAIFTEAMEVHVIDVNQQAALAALAAHDPGKLKDVLPQPQNRKPESARNGINEFIRKVGSC